MKLLVDTSIIVKLDRKDKITRDLLKKFSQDHQLFLSTITLAEILTGSYLREDFAIAARKAKGIMGRFLWVELDAKCDVHQIVNDVRNWHRLHPDDWRAARRPFCG